MHEERKVSDGTRNDLTGMEDLIESTEFDQLGVSGGKPWVT